MMNIYCDRNVNYQALRNRIGFYEKHGFIKLIQFPFEEKNKRVREYGIPTKITWAEWKVPWNKSQGTWQDMKYSENFLQIQQIIGTDIKHDGDCRHLDVAFKNKCTIFLTSDRDILSKKRLLEDLLGFEILNPDQLEEFKRLTEIIESQFGFEPNQKF